ncbi:hypothetical protein CEXT_764231 [Caerostris extrusa]|uniref:Uncharacterized protein n=1 Tax=Caerostris extrusa TaxID=172846 RepID=A0AAV4X6X3_CAEEX|nr:hypothetical protein CEXT_764231 [Caerostris extrusa]
MKKYLAVILQQLSIKKFGYGITIIHEETFGYNITRTIHEETFGYDIIRTIHEEIFGYDITRTIHEETFDYDITRAIHEDSSRWDSSASPLADGLPAVAICVMTNKGGRTGAGWLWGAVREDAITVSDEVNITEKNLTTPPIDGKEKGLLKTSDKSILVSLNRVDWRLSTAITLIFPVADGLQESWMSDSTRKEIRQRIFHSGDILASSLSVQEQLARMNDR